MDNRVYWIWLQQGLKYASSKIRAIRLIYEDVEKFYYEGSYGWKMCGCFNAKEIKAIEESSLEDAASILDKCLDLGYEVITMDDKRYPERLKNIPNPPCVLYVKGEMPDIDSKICISVVGTRYATLQGLQASFDISFELAREGVVIVSGGALGVDAQAHKGAIQGRGKTVAVLGCGIDCKYLAQNSSLRDAIAQNGALISEFIPDFPAYKQNFPMRNRIISGLSQGTVVVEAGEKSGSLITADFAKEQSRDLFAVSPGTQGCGCEGVNKLIFEGAKPVVCAEDVLSEYRSSYFRRKDFEDKNPIKIFHRPTQEDYKAQGADTEIKKVERVAKNKQTKGEKSGKIEPERKKEVLKKPKFDIMRLSFEEQTVYNVLKDGKKSVDSIVMQSRLPINKVLSSLTCLELYGMVERYAGKIYGVKSF